ncbi:MAG: TatA/E family twin arginine-targeting protein translocase [Actinomycetota bacterium]|jgi:sec-independent protein translocase protein TatA|nr:TatA/E family twin arginine-targeting protein translocase [Actinomycetota bacterium]
MFGLGWQELLIILIIALIIFGPRKLPEIGKSLGQAINGFKESTKKASEEVKKEVADIEKTVNNDSNPKA